MASTRLRPRSRTRFIMRSDAPCAVIMTVGVVTAAGWCSVRIPFSCSDAITVSLCTSSPRMVSGCAWAWFSASAMASRTPKHMPRCSARIIFIRLRVGVRAVSAAKSFLALYGKVKDHAGPMGFKVPVYFPDLVC